MNFDTILRKLGLQRADTGLTIHQQAKLAEARRTIRKAGFQSILNTDRNQRYGETMTASDYQAEKKKSDEYALRAVHSVNSRWGIMGIPREHFSKFDNDTLAENATYALCEKATLDYFGPAEWEVTDDRNKEVGTAVDFLSEPNPQQGLNDLILEATPDTLRYDQAVWVKGLNLGEKLVEMKCYSGPEFWIEVDREWRDIEGDYGATYVGPWSKGYVKHFWQHSRPGIYIPFEPREICHFKLYPRSDTIYGTDFLSRLKWQLEYLIDSTKAAGMTFSNGISPGAVMTHPQYTTLEQLEERNDELEFENLGPENFGGILHLIGEETISSFTPSMVDMEWLKGQKFVSELVWAMFGFSASEFTSGDINRATAYINRNITKTRMLYRLQRSYETMINRQVLPFLPGYQKGWKFKFQEEVELDDELKRAQINSAKLQNAMMATQMGIPIVSALKLAEVDDDVTTAVEEELGNMDDQNTWDAGLPNQLSPEEAEQYYADEDEEAYTEDYQGTSDTDQMTGEEDDDPLTRKAVTMTMHDGELRILEHDTIQKAREEISSLDWLAGQYDLPGRLVVLQGPGIRKARVYLKQGEKPPGYAQVHDGPRGGRYYETSGAEAVKEAQSYHPSGDRSTPGRRRAAQGTRDEPLLSEGLPGIPAGVTKRGMWVHEPKRAADRDQSYSELPRGNMDDYEDREDLEPMEKASLEEYQLIRGYRLINRAARTGKRNAKELRDELMARIREKGDTFHRAGQTPQDVWETSSYTLQRTIDRIDHAIAKSELPDDWTLYRGISPSLLKAIGSKLKPGDCFAEKGYGSWTMNPARCLFHATPLELDDVGEPGVSEEYWTGSTGDHQGPRVVLKARCKRGTKALYLDGAPWSDHISGSDFDRNEDAKYAVDRDDYDSEEEYQEAYAGYRDDTDSSEILFARNTAWRVVSVEGEDSDSFLDNLMDNNPNDNYASGEYTEGPVLVITVDYIGEAEV